jgi:hypothetical protein
MGAISWRTSLPQSEKLSLYREIHTHGYEASVIASYNVSFPFYERVVLPQLQASGCRHNILLVDARQCAEQIASDGDGPRLCGSEYTLLPIGSAAAFHPKFVMLLGRRGAKVAVGSHNMTIAGFGLNREIGTVYEVGGDESGAPARQIWRFIQEWTAEFPDAIQHLIFSSEQISPWLHSEDEVDSEILISSATGPNLWETLRPRLPKQVSRLSVIAPYFDSNLDFLKRLDRELHPKELIVAIHPRFSEIRPDAKRVLARARFVDVSMMRGDWSEKLLHAKLYCFEGVRGQTVVVTGSANASSPAWLDSAGRQNAEIIVVHEDGAKLWSQLGLKALHALPEVTSEAWNVVRDRSAERPKSEDLHHPVPFLAVTTEEGFLVDAEFSQGAATKDVWVINEDGKTAVDEITTRKDQSLFVCRDSRVRTSATRLEVRRGKKAARVAIVHHTDALLDKAAGNARQAFRRALSGLDGNPEELASVFAFVEKALFDSPINVDQAGAGGRRNSPPQDTPDLDREIGSMMISAGDTVRARRRRRVEATSDLALLIDVLVYKLGIGLRHDADTAASVRSEEELAQSEDAPEPTIDGSALARLCRGKVNRSRPKVAVVIGSEGVNPRLRDLLRSHENRQLSILEKAEAARTKRNPQTAVGRGQDRVDVFRRKGDACRRRVALELHAVETKESARRSDPQKSVGRLGQRRDLTGRAVLRGPCGVMKLRDDAVATQREHRVAHVADEKTDNDRAGKHSSNLHLARWKASLNGGSRGLLHVVMREPAVEAQKGSRCGIRAVMSGPGHCCPVTVDTANA